MQFSRSADNRLILGCFTATAEKQGDIARLILARYPQGKKGKLGCIEFNAQASHSINGFIPGGGDNNRHIALVFAWLILGGHMPAYELRGRDAHTVMEYLFPRYRNPGVFDRIYICEDTIVILANKQSHAVLVGPHDRHVRNAEELLMPISAKILIYVVTSGEDYEQMTSSSIREPTPDAPNPVIPVDLSGQYATSAPPPSRFRTPRREHPQPSATASA